MRPIKSNMALALLATLLGLVACANQMEPAQQALSRAESSREGRYARRGEIPAARARLYTE